MPARLWERSTRPCLPAALPVEMRNAVRACAERHRLGDVERASLACCLTTSKRLQRGLLDRLLGRSATQQMGALVTPSVLVWSISDGGETFAVAARLAEVEVTDHAQSDRAALVEDAGLVVFGFRIGASERATMFLGLGPGEAADAFRAAVRGAAAASPR